ncbi:MAG: hypothetical protein P8170_01180 [Gemmatimonadota bacterium]
MITRLGLLALLLHPSGVAGQITLLGDGDRALELSGYVRSLTGIYDLGYELPGDAEEDATSGFNGEVVRLKWTTRLGPKVTLELHQRLQTQVTTTASALGGSVAGFGVSAVPDRTVDLSTDFITRDRLRAWHDIDRLALSVYTEAGDLTLGRQAITWGISNLFPVADLWAQFSPFELDTEEKPGIDAIRFLTYPGSGWEVDAVVADRGSLDDLSAAVRASVALSWADLYVAGGKLWNEAMAMAGMSAPVGAWKLRSEAVLPYDLDDDEIDRIRATLGVDWMGNGLVLSGEYHFNGVGAGDPADYVTVLSDPRFARGESYYLGRHYAGGAVVWTPGNDRLNLTVSALLNLQDPSTAITPVLTYDFGQSTRVSAGGMITSGSTPTLGGAPALNSEYGTYGNLVFLRMSVYF